MPVQPEVVQLLAAIDRVLAAWRDGTKTAEMAAALHTLVVARRTFHTSTNGGVL